MKYSEDLEKYKNSKGNYNINNQIYYLGYCKKCKEKCLLKSNGKYCSNSCSKSKENHHNFGKKFSEDFKNKLRKAQIREKSHRWKGGVTKLNIPLYDTYASQLEKYEEVRKSLDGCLEVKCTYCGKWFVPKANIIQNRINRINGKGDGEGRLYCSKECKLNCPLYGKNPSYLMIIDAIDSVINNLDNLDIKSLPIVEKDLTREVQPELRKLVFERDNWTCIKCSATTNLHCHHIEGIQYNPIESADIDLCITFCETCHRDAHKDIGCRYSDLRCKNESVET